MSATGPFYRFSITLLFLYFVNLFTLWCHLLESLPWSTFLIYSLKYLSALLNRAFLVSSGAHSVSSSLSSSIIFFIVFGLSVEYWIPYSILHYIAPLTSFTLSAFSIIFSILLESLLMALLSISLYLACFIVMSSYTPLISTSMPLWSDLCPLYVYHLTLTASSSTPWVSTMSMLVFLWLP